MPENEHDALAARIKAARQAHTPQETAHEKQAESAVNAGGLALRYGAEMAGAVLVSIVLGLTIDEFFSTAPWGFLIMLGFGLAAGILGVIRAYQRINADVQAMAEQQNDE